MNSVTVNTKSKHLTIVSGLFYYLGMIALCFAFILATYWQLEEDPAVFEFTEIEVISTPENRGFYIPVNFCNKDITKFTVSRAYKDIIKNIYYTVPDGEYHSLKNECFNTLLVGNTGRLDPGKYEYSIFVKYDINPLRSVQLRVALVHVTIE